MVPEGFIILIVIVCVVVLVDVLQSRVNSVLSAFGLTILLILNFIGQFSVRVPFPISPRLMVTVVSW